METYFINKTLDNAIKDYLKSKDKEESVLYNSFLVVIVRMLVNIYGELDIVNPYQIKSESVFKNNLMKYGASEDEINNLFSLIDNDVNNTFIPLQKCLIDLFNLKRLNFGLTETDSKEFFDLLYTPGTSNPLRLSYNFLHAGDIYEVAEYYKEAMNKQKEMPKLKEEKDLLPFDVYKLFKISIADLSKLNNEEIDKLNKNIYASFNISDKAINKKYLLEEQIQKFKMQNTPLTTGNGYVDILIVMSIIVTGIMVVVIFSTIVF